jgi:predicted metal-binding membrane protein
MHAALSGDEDRSVTRSGHRLAPVTAALLILASAAWFLAVLQMRGMGGMPGVAGLGLVGFLAIWAPMMAAMMLPSSTPLAAMYARSVRTHRAARLGVFTVGYLLVWTAIGLPLYAVASWAGDAVAGHGTAQRVVAAAVFGLCGLYQLTPVKQRCLTVCRSPFAHVLHYASFRGRLRDLRAGLHHGGFCAACCWALMALIIAFGVMNLWAMVALAAVVLVEKLWRHGPLFAKIVGVVALGLAVAVIWMPDLAPGLHEMVMM